MFEFAEGEGGGGGGVVEGGRGGGDHLGVLLEDFGGGEDEAGD